MNKNYIEFKKQRDFGLLLSDTFGFIRNEFKPFLKTILTISGPALVLFLVAMSTYTYYAGDILSFDVYGGTDFGFNNLGFLLLAALAYMVSMVIALIFVSSSALHYIKSYIKNSGEVNVQEIKHNVSKTFWGYLGLGFLKYLTLFVAMLLCFFPVLYVMVPMFIVFSIYVFEGRRGASSSYSYGYDLINEDFWLSIGTIIVLFILIYVLSMVFSVPAAIYTYLKTGILSGEIDPESLNTFQDPVYILINVISNLFSILLNLVLIVASAFLYFHLNEKRNFTGTYQRISNIGQIEE
ncbi:hypothetical protein BTO05_13310 [Winogradskyella sp. PC-19]|uniref:hypothetical protein n=1 Tax=unclassified Winogradskyella TaxID=2615021 RepID=UPI000B3C313F|nr:MULTISPECIES: hypothetical protein [unclassified Winogradskyella]ARV10563.1 hypothetical protein BTO05_13310 [Winogradskyella sp. PC-19]RZN75292.1 MAG: hypothetical protein EVB12_07420 [Winogradskyella sp.]